MTKRLTKSELKAWTDYLRKHPERQGVGSLADRAYIYFCCLGALCEVQGVQRCTLSIGLTGGYVFSNGYNNEVSNSAHLGGLLQEKLGSFGDFAPLGMPDLRFGDTGFASLAEANDNRVPWLVIANHLDAFYPAVEG